MRGCRAPVHRTRHRWSLLSPRPLGSGSTGRRGRRSCDRAPAACRTIPQRPIRGDARTLPRSSEVRAAALTLAERFPARGVDPITVIAAADADDPVFDAWLDEASTSTGVLGTSIRPGTPPRVTVIDVVPSGTSQGSQATSLVEGLRANRPAFDIEVGGPAAELIDVKDRLADRLPIAAAVVCCATPVLRFLMTGSLIVPIKAVLMNVLRLGASLGALAWIFQDGHLSGRARLRLGRRSRSLDAGADPDLRIRVVDGLRGVPALAHQGSARSHRRQRSRRRRRPPAIRPHHHVRRSADRRGLRRLRRR